MARRPDSGGPIRIVVYAGLAFGTGAHETTRLCLEAIERHLNPGMTVIDVGTGSGILAEAAVKLGAGAGARHDNDPEAVAVARENFERAVSMCLCLSDRPEFSGSLCRPDRRQHQSRLDCRSRTGVGAGAEARRTRRSQWLRGK